MKGQPVSTHEAVDGQATASNTMCASFTDKMGRTIEISGDYDVIAKHKGNKIGEIQFDERDQGTILFGVSVNEEYRRAGIASAMMKRAVTIHGADFGKPSLMAYGGKCAASEDYYTQEGGAFIRSCIRRGFLSDTEVQNEPNCRYR